MNKDVIKDLLLHPQSFPTTSEGLLWVPKKGLLTEVLVLSKLNSHCQSTVEQKMKEDSRGLSWKAQGTAKSVRKKSSQKGKIFV